MQHFIAETMGIRQSSFTQMELRNQKQQMKLKFPLQEMGFQPRARVPALADDDRRSGNALEDRGYGAGGAGGGRLALTSGRLSMLPSSSGRGGGVSAASSRAQKTSSFVDFLNAGAGSASTRPPSRAGGAAGNSAASAASQFAVGGASGINHPRFQVGENFGQPTTRQFEVQGNPAKKRRLG